MNSPNFAPSTCTLIATVALFSAAMSCWQAFGHDLLGDASLIAAKALTSCEGLLPGHKAIKDDISEGSVQKMRRRRGESLTVLLSSRPRLLGPVLFARWQPTRNVPKATPSRRGETLCDTWTGQVRFEPILCGDNYGQWRGTNACASDSDADGSWVSFRAVD